MVCEIISTVFKIYQSFLRIYQRFSKYIAGSTENIDLPTNNDTKKVCSVKLHTFFITKIYL
ncbi:hypothetical protein FH038_05145 [Bacillus sp. CD3-1a]|nr:hypothetical protein FH038_05145 [Bacillus sp. CD3-1a]